MNLKNKILSLIVTILTVPNVEAGKHFDPCPDQKYIELGSEYPSVGYFSAENEPMFGSGTLIDLTGTNYEHLNGRVVLTCSHIFTDNEDDDNDSVFSEKENAERIKDTVFTIGNQSSKGRVFMHKNWVEACEQSKHDRISDISLFLLDAPFTSPLSAIKFNESAESLLNKTYVIVGYGDTGHVAGDDIWDGQKRGVKSFGLPNSAVKDVETQSYYTMEEYGLELSPFKLDMSCYPVKFSEKLEVSGILGDGDSGGGVFSEDKSLVAIGVIAACSSDSPQKIITRSYYNQYKGYFDSLIPEAETHGVKIAIVDDIEKYITPSEHDKDWLNFSDSASADNYLSYRYTSYSVPIFMHKSWFFETLDACTR